MYTLKDKLDYDTKRNQFLASLSLDQLVTLRDLLNRDLASTIKPLTTAMCQAEVLSRVNENETTTAASGW